MYLLTKLQPNEDTITIKFNEYDDVIHYLGSILMNTTAQNKTAKIICGNKPHDILVKATIEINKMPPITYLIQEL